MKIMTIMYTSKRGGSYERFKMTVETFIERACEVHCLSLTPIPVSHPLYYNHILVFPQVLQTRLVRRLIILCLFPFYSLLVAWREGIDIFVAFGTLYAFIQAIPKLFLRRRMVTLVRGKSSFGLRTENSSSFLLWVNRMIEYLGLISSDKTIAVNRAIREEIISVKGISSEENVDVLFNNIPAVNSSADHISKVRPHLGIPKYAEVLVTAGPINQGKNIDTLIKCLALLNIDTTFLLIVGEAATKAGFSYKNYLHQLTETLGLQKRVFFTGWVEKTKLWRIFFASDLFILPSINEGMPNALLEALGCDIPCLGSDIPGIREVLHYDELMFSPFDVKALANKIRRTIDERSFFEKIKGLCRERKILFTFDWKERLFQMVTG